MNALAPDNTEDTNAMQNEPTEPQVWVNSD